MRHFSIYLFLPVFHFAPQSFTQYSIFSLRPLFGKSQGKSQVPGPEIPLIGI